MWCTTQNLLDYAHMAPQLLPTLSKSSAPSRTHLHFLESVAHLVLRMTASQHTSLTYTGTTGLAGQVGRQSDLHRYYRVGK